MNVASPSPSSSSSRRRIHIRLHQRNVIGIVVFNRLLDFGRHDAMDEALLSSSRLFSSCWARGHFIFICVAINFINHVWTSNSGCRQFRWLLVSFDDGQTFFSLRFLCLSSTVSLLELMVAISRSPGRSPSAWRTDGPAADHSARMVIYSYGTCCSSTSLARYATYTLERLLSEFPITYDARRDEGGAAKLEDKILLYNMSII